MHALHVVAWIGLTACLCSRDFALGFCLRESFAVSFSATFATLVDAGDLLPAFRFLAALGLADAGFGSAGAVAASASTGCSSMMFTTPSSPSGVCSGAESRVDTPSLCNLNLLCPRPAFISWSTLSCASLERTPPNRTKGLCLHFSN